MKNYTIRIATLRDAKQLLAIYAPYVLNTNITFEYTVPSLREFKKRIKNTLKKYPYYVAEENGRILGYAYASAFKGRAAYNWSVETSIYIEESVQKGGIGSALYAKLEETLKRQNITNVNACIAWPHPQSVAFHKKHGYTECGHFTKCGYKMNTWLDMIWMEKFLMAEHPAKPEPFIPFPKL